LQRNATGMTSYAFFVIRGSVRMESDVKSFFRLIQRTTGIYFCENRQTRQQKSLRTRDPREAERLLHAKNEAQEQPGYALQITRT
jgi:hypothetical protein